MLFNIDYTELKSDKSSIVNRIHGSQSFPGVDVF